MSKKERRLDRISRIREKAALAVAKAAKRKWLVFLLLTGATLVAICYAFVKSG